MKKEMIFKPTKALELLIQSPILKQLYIPDSVYIKIYPLNQIFSIFRNINTQSHSSHLNFVINPLLYKKKATVVFFFQHALLITISTVHTMIGHLLSWFCFYSTMATTVIDLQWFCVHMEDVSQYTCTHQCTGKSSSLLQWSNSNGKHFGSARQ